MCIIFFGFCKKTLDKIENRHYFKNDLLFGEAAGALFFDFFDEKGKNLLTNRKMDVILVAISLDFLMKGAKKLLT